MWSDGLSDWFTANGRHGLPWRLTSDPWAVLVSEVMLQQTSVPRVLPRWQRFVERWPTSAACAAATIEDVLREWQGLGYPRRARALWLTAARVTNEGWPKDEAALLDLPGVGTYTARALLAFTELGAEAGLPPRDVNLSRVAARAGLGREAHEVTPAALDFVLRGGRPPAMSMRDYSYALFDVGATLCRARPACPHCPLRAGCAARTRELAAPPPPRRPPYAGSLRQLRGALLAQSLQAPAASEAQLAAMVSAVPGATPQRVRSALDGLIADGLLGGAASPQR